VRRLLVAALASLVIAGLIAPAVAAAPAANQERAGVAKVVVVVGPAGAATNRYRAQAKSAAAVARQYTSDVTEIYSPNATWPAVRKALQGASLVIYMGHGNGWPSRYRDSLYPPSQNGFGLNPTAPGNDYSHQYFGEGLIADDVKLAKNAVVLLNHLCYASGNTEPGLAEGTLAQARQRVDNYAAGFIKAGAAAVIAEAYDSPNHMVRVVLGGKRSIEAAWRGAPSANGNRFAFESTRSPGYIAQMDPERDSSGFSRSIVIKRGLASADVLRNARGTATAGAAAAVDATALVPSLAGTGVELASPVIQGSTAIEGKINFKIPFSIADRDKLPKALQASVRWDLLEPAAADPGAEAASPEATTGAAVPEIVAPDFGLISAERLGDLVAPTTVKIGRTQMAFKIGTPAAAGRYRLTVTLHDSDGVAYDPVTQAQIPSLLVRVTGDLDAGIDAPASLDLAPGATTDLSVWVANLGRTAWGHKAFEDPRDPEGTIKAEAAQVTGTWVALGAANPDQLAAADAASVDAADLPAGFKARSVKDLKLRLFAPSVAGEYLLLLDIVTPEAGSLTARGVEATMVRVTVAETVAPAATPAAPAASPAATPAEAPADTEATEAAPAASDAAPAASPSASPAAGAKKASPPPSLPTAAPESD
jgi:hypothetical protein